MRKGESWTSQTSRHHPSPRRWDRRAPTFPESPRTTSATSAPPCAPPGAAKPPIASTARPVVRARAWAAAQVKASGKRRRRARHPALDGIIEEQVWYRGEIVGTRRRYDTRLLLTAHGPASTGWARTSDARSRTPSGSTSSCSACAAGKRFPTSWRRARATSRSTTRDRRADDGRAGRRAGLRRHCVEALPPRPRRRRGRSRTRGSPEACDTVDPPARRATTQPPRRARALDPVKCVNFGACQRTCWRARPGPDAA